jgi:AraC-like DNA-binding protein
VNITIDDLHGWAGKPLSDPPSAKSFGLAFERGSHGSRAEGWFEAHRAGAGLEIVMAGLTLSEPVELVSHHHKPCIWFLLTPTDPGDNNLPRLSQSFEIPESYPGFNTVGINSPGESRLFLSARTRHLFVKVSIDVDRLNGMARNCAPTFSPASAAGVGLLTADEKTTTWRISCRLDYIAHQAIAYSHYEQGRPRALFMEAKALEIIGAELSDLFSSTTMCSTPLSSRETAEVKQARLSLCRYSGLSPKFFGESATLQLIADALQDLCDEASCSRAELAAPDKKTLHEARRILEQEFMSPPGLVELARRAGTNEFKLKRGFRKLFGTTVFGYVRDLRMKRARHLLEQDHLNVTQVAFEVGYSSLGHFSAAFRRRFGVLPSKYRACWRENGGTHHSL